MNDINTNSKNKVKVDSILKGFPFSNPPLEEDLYKCVHCGFCLQACPTYVQTGLETESPRGRIALMKGVIEGRLTMNNDVIDHWVNAAVMPVMSHAEIWVRHGVGVCCKDLGWALTGVWENRRAFLVFWRECLAPRENVLFSAKLLSRITAGK